MRKAGTKRCVGDPPRQTEDPLAPPCVPFFDGDNFGATYQGVTKDEIRLLVLVDGGINYISGSDANNTVLPRATYYDLLQPPEDDEHLVIKGLRGWQRYFNERFQTYGRFVHFYVWSSGCTPCTPEARRADAAARGEGREDGAVRGVLEEEGAGDGDAALERRGDFRHREGLAAQHAVLIGERKPDRLQPVELHAAHFACCRRLRSASFQYSSIDGVGPIPSIAGGPSPSRTGTFSPASLLRMASRRSRR